MVIGKDYGIGRYVYNLLENMIALNRQDEFTLLVNDDWLLPLVNDCPNFKLLKVGIKWLSLEEQVLIPLVLRRLRPDLFHAASFAVPLIQPCRTVVTIYDLIHLVFPGHYTLLHRFYFQVVLRWALRRAAKIITISESSRSDLVSFYGLPKGKIEIAYPAVDAKFKPLDRGSIANFKKKRGLPDHFVLYVGNRKQHKNIPGLIAAYSKFREQDRGAHYLVLSGSADEATASLARRYRVEDRLFYAQNIADDELPLMYNSADVFVFPSLYEGFGLPALEALACGVPVIASNVSSLPEVVGDAGILVDPRDPDSLAAAIGRAANDPELARRLRERGPLRSAQFSWQKCARETLQIYRRTM
jgi:glycosyltransferase involved in cell wall biosynthesis